MKRKRISHWLLAVFVVCAAIALQAWAASHKSEPAILPADAALYSWGYYAFSELAWASRESTEAVAMSPLEMDALKSVPDSHGGGVDVARRVLAISRTSNIILVDIPTWETLRTFDTGQSIQRIALAPNLSKIAFVTCPPHTISDC